MPSFDRIYGELSGDFEVDPYYNSWERNGATRQEIFDAIKYLTSRLRKPELKALYKKLVPAFEKLSEEEKADNPKLSYGEGT